MNSKTVHIITFDTPFPPDYGGNQDVFYRLKALKEAQVQIILHIFASNSKKSEELTKICAEIYYYEKKKYKNLIFGKMPYRTALRSDKHLLKRLTQDDFPLFFEGLHCAYYANFPELAHRKKFLRAHNIEHEYMRHLAKGEKNLLKKLYYLYEYQRFKWQENHLNFSVFVFAITENNQTYFHKKGFQAEYLPVFHPNKTVTNNSKSGKYILIHGNMSVPENYRAVNYFLTKIYSKIDFPLKIAGKNPPKWLKNKISKLPEIDLVENCTEEKMRLLVSEAQILFLYTEQTTGIKLKLINSLFQGKHVIANEKMTENTDLETLCHWFHTAEEAIQLIEKLKNTPFTQEEIEKRKKLLYKEFSNSENVKKIVKKL
ncbi:MAG: hypothetical protein LBT29_06140 [Flavobacteriaceae bacterium]|jgi:hypothetical protein|nr:hypothetical protein [Flavobacteriaceae bacterium]